VILPRTLRASLLKASLTNAVKPSQTSIWEKGMLMRRLVVTWTVRYGKVHRWNVLKPVMKQGEVVDKAKFDIELVEDSGGGEDTELDKLRIAVSNFSLFTLQAIDILMLTFSY
jgi:hypothetical protein